MPSNLQTLSRSSNTAVATPPPPPTIRLISATPSASGNSSTSSITNIAIDSSWSSVPHVPSPLAPKPDSPATRKRLVPKKSKLSILGVGREKERGKDLSDVVRRIGGDSASARGGFEIYVDPTIDEDIGEIVVIKKKKSRQALDGMRWGTLGEVTNVPAVSVPKEAPALLKVKGEENKWWSIGRGRKDSKEKTEKATARAKSPEPAQNPYPRSMTPEPFKLTQLPESSRSRFNSLDSGILLSTNPAPSAPSFSTQPLLPLPEDGLEPIPITYTRSGTPTAGGLLAPPIAGPQLNASNQGSIAIRAMRSVRSLARIGSWAQLNNDENVPVGSVKVKTTKEKEKEKKEKEKEKTIKEKEKTTKEKEKKEKEEAKKAKEEKKAKKSKKEKDTIKEKDEDAKKKKTKKKDKEKETEKEKEKEVPVKDTLRPNATARLSTSSFEIGTASPMPKDKTKSLGKKKHSILGLGLPSSMTMRLPTVRNGSTASSIGPAAPPFIPAANRLSVDSAHILNMGPGRDRAGSIISTSTTGSSLRPMSETSSMSGSRISSGSSIRWDEDCLENVKETRKRERRERERERAASGEVPEGKRARSTESRHSAEGRRRTPLSEVFPIFGRAESPLRSTSSEATPQPQEKGEKPRMPVVMVEAATADGHCAPDDDSILEDDVPDEMELETPMKRARPRPLSEQLLGRSRPKPLYEGEDGVLSILDAATNDLAQLINHLDLEATPATPDMTPLRPSNALLSSLTKNGSPSNYAVDSPTKHSKNILLSGSPLRKTPHNMPSISSLRPYAQSRKNMPAKPPAPSVPEEFIGQPITPWPTLLQNMSPIKSPKNATITSKASSSSDTPTFRPGHKRTMTPGPEPEPSPVFMPLRPAKSRGALTALKAPFELQEKKHTPKKKAEEDSPFNDGTVRAPSLRTFGSHSSTRIAQSILDASFTSEALLNPSPVFKRASAQRLHRPSLLMDVDEDNDTVPIPPETRRILGMSGTMGGSDVSGYAVELDASDPDSDIPDELQNILSGQSDDGDTMSFREDPNASFLHDEAAEISMPSGPPVLELPTFRAQLIDEEENHADIEADVEAMSSDEDNTKKSFDFTGEINKLNESGGSDRHSFVEQLENAFRTPAKIDLRYGFPSSLLGIEVPPVPKLPLHLASETSQSSSSAFDGYSGSGLVDVKELTLLQNMTDDSDEKSRFDLFSGSQIVDIKEPTLLQGSDSLISSDGTEDIVMSDTSISSSSKSLRAASSSGSRPSDGQLNKAFKFGGLPKAPEAPVMLQDKPKTLADIIPPPSHVRSLSNSSMMEDEDSVLKSIFLHASEVPHPRVRLNSDSSAKRRAREGAQIQYRHSRHSSGMSFAGFDSFDEVRRGFEFSNDQPFYPPPAATRRTAHRRQQESLFSIASVSSYGKAHDYGLNDPFDYGLPSLRERPSSEDMSSISMSMSVDDTFSFLDHQPRRRVASDASSFYFKAPTTQSFSRGHRRHESNMSISSIAPPVSLYNRSFGAHRRNDSSSSAQSVAFSYAMHGANGGRAAWARHRQDSSMDSVNSDFSAMRLGRPGIGDKMFDKMFDSTMDHGMPLTSISASPPESIVEQGFGNRSSFDFDSIMDHERRSSMLEDSLFEKTGDRSSVSSDSVFGCDDSRASRGALLKAPQYRPLSVLSMNPPNSPMREDDTMISMLGGGHVRRRSIEASPCPKMEKRKHSAIQAPSFNDRETPSKARIVEKPSIASTSSFSFGGERMIKAKRGLLERQSLEDSCLIADGEDLQGSLQTIPIFTRPGPATRSRSSTCTSSSGGDTPPLSSSDGCSSMDEGSQSSIDLSQINFALANATHPMSTLARNRVRARARGHGHRRRASYARASRSSVYETIQEEMTPSPNKLAPSQKNTPTVCQPIFIVEPETSEIDPGQIWDDENGIIALRRYYALRDEAQTTVVESKRVWRDTPFSLYAVQSFEPPRHPAGMQALLEHSVQNYGPLPSELRPRRIRSRTSSRPSPYPQARVSKVFPPSPEKVQRPKSVVTPPASVPVLQQVTINSNIMTTAPSLDVLKAFSPLVMDIEPKRENAFGLAPHARPRVASTARRTALGWTKRSTGSSKTSTDQKENVGQGMVQTPGESLRINRPRPRGRPTPASTARPIRV